MSSVRQHTSAYVSIRQHTPAYASKHTSAYETCPHTYDNVHELLLDERTAAHAGLTCEPAQNGYVPLEVRD